MISEKPQKSEKLTLTANDRERCPVCGRFLTSRVNVDGMLLVDVESVPESQTGRAFETTWDKIFSKIPKGKALAIPNEAVRYDSVFHALKRWQSKGKFLELKLAKRKLEEKVTTYVINPKT